MLAPTLPTPPEHSSDRQISPREVSIWKLLAVAALIVLAVATVSYVRALMTPGYASWNDKTSSWIRELAAIRKAPRIHGRPVRGRRRGSCPRRGR